MQLNVEVIEYINSIFEVDGDSTAGKELLRITKLKKNICRNIFWMRLTRSVT